MALLADGVSGLFIDGKVSTGSAGTFPTINPATEEVLGVAADADADDMGRAIDAARRAFDDTDWSRNTELRVRCVRQLQEAMKQHLEELRAVTVELADQGCFDAPEAVLVSAGGSKFFDRVIHALGRAGDRGSPGARLTTPRERRVSRSLSPVADRPFFF